MDPHGDMMAAVQDMGAHGEHDHDHEMCLAGDDEWMTDSEGEGIDDGDVVEEIEVDTSMEGSEKSGELEGKDGEGGGTNGIPSKKRKRSRRESKGWADDDDEEEKEKEAAPRLNPMEQVSTEGDSTSTETTTSSGAPSTTETPVEKTVGAEGASVSMPADIEDNEDWKRFEVLEETPTDHHYANEVIQVPSKSFMSRVRKEHGVLASSLPREFPSVDCLSPLAFRVLG